jgi:glycosyltransferase involved in cell wall biosynthesis
MTSPGNKYELAVVIPAYKARFLRRALESIAQQTNKRFKVYVGDDASPENIEQICDDFSHRLELRYTGFEKNLGSTSLVQHWNRCVNMSSEPCIWLFCDDDLMEPNCVEMFYQTNDRENRQHRVLRFNTLTIDDTDHVIRINPPHPLTESGIRFIYHRLKGERLSYLSEYIFAREAFIENSGMIDFPLAWCSDDASWLAYSKGGEILTIQEAQVHWRRGAFNITPSGARNQIAKMEAAFEFVGWLSNFLDVNGTGNQQLSRETMQALLKAWFIRQLRGVAPIGALNYLKFARYAKSVTEMSWISCWVTLLKASFGFYIKSIVRLSRPPFHSTR